MNLTLTSFSKNSLRQNGRTFWLASFFLPRQQARHATELYAFCRLIDDLADDPTHGNQGLLCQLKRYFNNAGAIPDELTVTEKELVCAIKTSGLDRENIEELLTGLKSDLGTTEFTTKAQLLRYAYAVAGTVGILMGKIMRCREREADFHAVDLGIAMQLTNIARDVLEDARLGRKYIPMSSTIEEIATKTTNDDISQNLDKVIKLAEIYYESGLKGLIYLPRKMRPCVYIMAVLYRAISRKLKNNELNWQEGRTVIGPFEKAWLIIRALPVCLWLIGSARPALKTIKMHQIGLHQDLNGLPGTHQ